MKVLSVPLIPDPSPGGREITELLAATITLKRMLYRKGAKKDLPLFLPEYPTHPPGEPKVMASICLFCDLFFFVPLW